MTAKQVIKLIEADGWVFAGQTGSHRTYKKDGAVHVVTVPGAGSEEVSIGVLSQIRRITGLKLR